MPEDPSSEAEEVNVDFGDDNVGDEFAVPVGLDSDRIPDSASARDRQTVSTFNYANDKRPEFLKGIPEDLPEKQGREATLGSAVVSLSSAKKAQQ